MNRQTHYITFITFSFSFLFLHGPLGTSRAEVEGMLGTWPELLPRAHTPRRPDQEPRVPTHGDRLTFLCVPDSFHLMRGKVFVSGLQLPGIYR